MGRWRSHQFASFCVSDSMSRRMGESMAEGASLVIVDGAGPGRSRAPRPCVSPLLRASGSRVSAPLGTGDIPP